MGLSYSNAIILIKDRNIWWYRALLVGEHCSVPERLVPDLATQGISLVFIVSADAAIVSQMREVNKQDKRPTYIESAKSSWDEIRGQVESRFFLGMECRSNSICES